MKPSKHDRRRAARRARQRKRRRARRFRSYDPANVIVTFNGIRLTGFLDGSAFIRSAPTPNFTLTSYTQVA